MWMLRNPMGVGSSRPKALGLKFGRARRYALAAPICIVAFTALADDVDRASLDAAFQKYTSCTTECAKSLAGQILNESVDVGLKTVGAIKASSAPDPIKYATFYVFLRSVYQSGQKVIGSNAACYNTCDALN